MERPEDPKSATHERRQSTRHPLQSKVRLTFDCVTFEGRAENVSHTDVLFSTEDGPPVTVEIEGDGIVKRVSGRLVRLQREDGAGISWAVEFTD